MTHLPKQRRSISARYTHSPWFWLTVTGGSIVVHAVLLYWVSSGTWQLRNQTAQSVTPIELINLPESAQRLPSGQLSPAGTPAGTAAGRATKTSQPTEPTLPETASASGSVAQAQILTPPSETVWSDLPPEPASQASEPLPSPQPEGQPPTASPTQAAHSTQPAANPDRDLDQVDDSASSRLNQAILPSPSSPQMSPQASPPASPQIITQPIDVPIPLGVEASPVGSPEVANIPQRVLVPSHFTASLTATALPSETSPTPDETAQPATDVKRVSRMFPCRVTPEVMQFLGKTVALQVATDATGQVVNTTTQESSDSLAYDQLAVCLVKNWEFRPAIAQGQAVANDGLVVRITIDRS